MTDMSHTASLREERYGYGSMRYEGADGRAHAGRGTVYQSPGKLELTALSAVREEDRKMYVITPRVRDTERAASARYTAI